MPELVFILIKMFFKWNGYTFREVTLPKVFASLTEKGSTLKGNSVLLEWTPFQKRTGVQQSKQEVTKVVSLVKNSPGVSIQLSLSQLQFLQNIYS